MMNENRLSHNDPIFHLVAPADSPIWGSAEDLKHWIRRWHENGCPVKNVQPDEKRMERLLEIAASEEKRRERNLFHSRQRAERRKKSQPPMVKQEPIEPTPALSIRESMDLLRREIAGEKFKAGTHESRHIYRARLYICKLRDDGKKSSAIAKRYNLPIHAVMLIYSEYQKFKSTDTSSAEKE